VQPNEGIKRLQTTLRQYRPAVLPKHIAIDLADLRQAVPDDEKFGDAIAAIAIAMKLVHQKRERIGTPLLHNLKTWYRYSFESNSGTDLRIVYQPLADGSIRLLGFGHRHSPASIYVRMTNRLKNEFGMPNGLDDVGGT
jgi:hypothetical protein